MSLIRPAILTCVFCLCTLCVVLRYVHRARVTAIVSWFGHFSTACHHIPEIPTVFMLTAFYLVRFFLTAWFFSHCFSSFPCLEYTDVALATPFSANTWIPLYMLYNCSQSFWNITQAQNVLAFLYIEKWIQVNTCKLWMPVPVSESCSALTRCLMTYNLI